MPPDKRDDAVLHVDGEPRRARIEPGQLPLNLRLDLAVGRGSRPRRRLEAGEEAAMRRGQEPVSLPFQVALIRDHLTGDDVHVERNRLIARRRDFDPMTSRRQAERLRGRRELIDGADGVAVDDDFGLARRDVEAQPAGVRLGPGWTSIESDPVRSADTATADPADTATADRGYGDCGYGVDG